MRILNGENLTATTNSTGDVTVDVTAGASPAIVPDDITGVVATVEDAYANAVRATRVDGRHYRFRIYKFQSGSTTPAANQQVTFNWIAFGV